MTPDAQLSNQTDALRELTDAAANLAGDPALIEALTKMLFAIEARLAGHELTAEQVSYLIETGAFVVSGKHDARSPRGKIEVQLVMTEGDYLHLRNTFSLNATAGHLGWNEKDVLKAVADGRLYAVEVLGLTRLPSWQFESIPLGIILPGRILPGVSKIIEVIDPQWPSTIIHGYMNAPQKGLIAEGRKTPIAWLRDGGDVETVVELIKTQTWGS